MSHGLSFFSLCTTPIQVMVGDVVCGTATGFFYRSENSDVFLVTNWHVVTGRKPTDPKISKNAAVPTTLRFFAHKKISEKGIKLNEIMQIDLSINSVDGSLPEWLEHPTLRHSVDVVAIKLDKFSEIDEQCTINILNDSTDLEKNYIGNVVDDVFVIGYPWGLGGGNKALPLFKRGSIASEPLVDHGALPRMLIDCRTSDSMSGSPVLVRHDGLWHPTGQMSDKSIFGTISNFLGVYSGRLIDNKSDEVSEIGIIWKKTALDLIVNEGVQGRKLEELLNN